jgi:phosphatidylglycerol:prolipoprotein diacylglycerol transferase
MMGSMAISRSEARRLGWDVWATSWQVVVATLVGFFGSHVLYAITRIDLPWDRWWRVFFNFGSGNVWYGGFLLAWLQCRHWAKKRGIPALELDDVAAFAVLAAQPVGRLGCFFGGCCYGIPTSLPWGVAPVTREFDFGTPLHPVPLYEALYLFTVLAVLWALRRKNRYRGQTAVRYLILQPAGRFVFEFFRGDLIRGFVAGWLSTSQFIALLLMAVGIGLHFHLRRKAAPAVT